MNGLNISWNDTKHVYEFPCHLFVRLYLLGYKSWSCQSSFAFDDDLHTWKNNSAHAQQSQPYNDIVDVSGFLQSLMLLENFLISRWNNELLVLHKHHESNVKFKLEICFKDLFLFKKFLRLPFKRERINTFYSNKIQFRDKYRSYYVFNLNP